MRLPGKFYSSFIFKMMLFSHSVSFGSIPCSPSWEVWHGIGYYVHRVPVVWAEAKELCKQLGGNLLMPKSSTENAFANKLLAKHGGSSAWLNCFRDGSWSCEVDGMSRWPPFNNPAEDQPYIHENCVATSSADWKWRHAPCGYEKTAVCEIKVNRMTIGAEGPLTTDG